MRASVRAVVPLAVAGVRGVLRRARESPVEEAPARDHAGWSGFLGEDDDRVPTLREQARARRAFARGRLPGAPPRGGSEDGRGPTADPP